MGESFLHNFPTQTSKAIQQKVNTKKYVRLLQFSVRTPKRLQSKWHMEDWKSVLTHHVIKTNAIYVSTASLLPRISNSTKRIFSICCYQDVMRFDLRGRFDLFLLNIFSYFYFFHSLCTLIVQIFIGFAIFQIFSIIFLLVKHNTVR